MALSPRNGAARRRPRNTTLLAALAGAAAIFLAAWAIALFGPSAEGGSLDARVTAVGATVRCPVCPEPISVNDQQNVQSQQMRLFIRKHLQRGESEDQVRADLLTLYGPTILLAPPQRGFDLLVWVVPLAAVTAAGVAVVVAVRRWSARAPHEPELGRALYPVDDETARYEDALDRELAARE